MRTEFLEQLVHEEEDAAAEEEDEGEDEMDFEAPPPRLQFQGGSAVPRRYTAVLREQRLCRRSSI